MLREKACLRVSVSAWGSRCTLVDMYGCACKCVCTQVLTGLYVQNRERQANSIF